VSAFLVVGIVETERVSLIASASRISAEYTLLGAAPVAARSRCLTFYAEKQQRNSVIAISKSAKLPSACFLMPSCYHEKRSARLNKAS
jgi:hypothetical protein